MAEEMNKLLELFYEPQSKPICEAAAMAYLVARAATKPKTFDNHGEKVKVNIGELILRLRPTSVAWGWDKMKVSRFLQARHDMRQLVVNRETGYIHVSICNYREYFDEEKLMRQVDGKSETVNETKGNLLETTSNLKQDNISESLASLDKYFFVDDLYRLTYGDYERLRKQFPNITRREFKAELKKACDWYRQKPEAIKNLHFQILAWLDKHNRKVG